jgi:nitrogen fixation protein FixH
MTGQAALRPRGHWIPWAFVAAFLAVTAVNGVMIYLAIESSTGVVAERPYEDGLRFNDTLVAAAEQSSLGWTVSPGFEGGVLSVRVTGADGRPLLGARVVAAFQRPLDESLAATIPLEPRDGAYAAVVDLPLPGAWDVTIRIEHAEGTYRLVRRLDAP